MLLPHVDGWAEHRARRGRAGTRRRGCPGRPPEPARKPAWHLHVVRDEQPDEVSQRLAAAGVQSRGYYRTPVHAPGGDAALDPPRVPLPATDEAARTHLALPMSASLTREQVSEVARAYGRAE